MMKMILKKTKSSNFKDVVQIVRKKTLNTKIYYKFSEKGTF